MPYIPSSAPPEPVITCPICNCDAFPDQTNSQVKELLNLTGRNRQLVTCQSCGQRFIVRKDQAEDFSVKAI